MAKVGRFPKLTIHEARAWQEEMRGRVVRHAPRGFAPQSVAGVDISVREDHAIAAIVVMRFPRCEVLEEVTAVRPVEFPYVPGYLAFREMPSIVDAWRKLQLVPDLLIVDGHGVAHPRRFGNACHVGVHMGVPSIGCGKTRFVGTHREPGERRGCRTRLVDGGEVIGSVLRTRDGVNPVHVSIGHQIDLDSAVGLLLRCSRYRLPDPIRAADKLAGEIPVG